LRKELRQPFVILFCESLRRNKHAGSGFISSRGLIRCHRTIIHIPCSHHQIFRGGTKPQDRGYDPNRTWGQTDFAIAKIGEGYNAPYRTIEGAHDGDRDFQLIWQGVAQIPIRGVYFYQRSGYSWQRQAEGVLNYIISAKLDLHMLWLDVEKINNVIDKSMLADMRRILDYWQANVPAGITVGLYANPDVVNNYIVPLGTKNYGKDWVDAVMAYPQWIAQYWWVKSPDKQPAIYKQYPHWHVWQYSDTGDSQEIRDHVTWRHYGSPDLNVFNGSVADMRTWLKIGETPPPIPGDYDPGTTAPPDGTEVSRATIITPIWNGTRLRTDHTTFANVVTSYNAGTQVSGEALWTANKDGNQVKAGDQWLRVTSVGGVSVSGWIAITHLGKPICKIVEHIPTPPLPQTGRYARLKWDVFRKEYNYTWRSPGKKETSNAPQTVTFNQVKRSDKGRRVKISTMLQDYMKKSTVNPDQRGWKILLDPKTGWLNKVTEPLTAEPLSFAGNDVLVIGESGLFSQVDFIPHNTADISPLTFFSPNGRLRIHKATAGKYTKIGEAIDAYLPFINWSGEEYWTLTERLEFFPVLPFTLDSGKIIIEYRLLGDNTYGLTADKEEVLLYSPQAQYPTNWTMKNKPVPPR